MSLKNTIQRVIGSYQGEEKGPLLICFGGMHGNELAGVKALESMFGMLEREPTTNPDFKFKGRLVGLRGNLAAIKAGKRFIDKDLNRQWTPENVARILGATSDEMLDSEDKEIRENLAIIHQEIKDYQPQKVIVLDLHTTTAFGGIFSIPTDDERSLTIAIELHAPVIRGMLKGIRGTSLHYFNTKNLGVDTVAVCFESGQHYEDLSVKRAIAALTNCMRTIGCVRAEDVENRHDKILIEYSKSLPKVSELFYCHGVKPSDGFVMKPNYSNFQRVVEGELLATDKNGEILAPKDCLVVMPLYQKQGDDGFFLVESVEGF